MSVQTEIDELRQRVEKLEEADNKNKNILKCLHALHLQESKMTQKVIGAIEAPEDNLWSDL